MSRSRPFSEIRGATSKLLRQGGCAQIAAVVYINAAVRRRGENYYRWRLAEQQVRQRIYEDIREGLYEK